MTSTTDRVKKHDLFPHFRSESRLCTVENVSIGQRVKALRQALGLTQQAIETASFVDEEDLVRRTEMVKIEKGVNRLTSFPKRKALARGMGLPLALLNAYLDEEIDLTELLRRKNAPPMVAVPTRYAQIDPRYPNLIKAVEFAEGQVSQEAIEKTIQTALQAAADPEPRDWWAMIEHEDRLIRLRDKNPAGFAAQRARDVERTKALAAESAPGAKRREKKSEG